MAQDVVANDAPVRHAQAQHSTLRLVVEDGENINLSLSIQVRRSFLKHKAKLLLKLERIEELENIFNEIWDKWQTDFNKLKKIARKSGADMNEITSI